MTDFTRNQIADEIDDIGKIYGFPLAVESDTLCKPKALKIIQSAGELHEHRVKRLRTLRGESRHARRVAILFRIRQLTSPATKEDFQLNRSIHKKWVALTLGGALLFAAAMPAHASTYTVTAGDSLWKIAKRANTTVSQLQAANPGVSPMKLQIGQTLTIPTASKATTLQPQDTYVVQGDETFWLIAKKLNLPVQRIMEANPTLNPRNLYHGLTIQLPTSATADRPGAKAADVALAAPSHAAAPTAQRTMTSSNVLTIGGQDILYSKVFDIKATAYSASAEENGKWGPVDYFGNPLKLGTIAVDPKVIPFGTKLYITGYNHKGLPVGGMYGTASDTGGAIKGNRIDIFIPGNRAEVATFGFQNVKVYILD